MNNSPKVFISYAREDQTQALRLSRDLQALGVQPWIDVTHLLPGGDWRDQIEAVLDVCDYVILMLSNHSIEKSGFVQVEKRYILDRLDHMPPGKIFLTPARLEECSPCHRQIQRLHWVDLFPSWNKGFKRLCVSLGFPEETTRTIKTIKARKERKSQALSAKDYFEVVLPTMLRWKGEEVTKLNKRTSFVMMDRPDESWTINLVEPKATVVKGEDYRADLIIRITSASMESILAGDFNARKAIAGGEVELSGDLTILKSMGILFTNKDYDISIPK